MVTRPLIDVAAGALQFLRNRVQFGGGGVIEALLQQGRGHPDGCRHRRQCSRHEDQNQSVTKAIHPFRPRPVMRGKSDKRRRLSMGAQWGSFSLGFRLRNSTSACTLRPRWSVILANSRWSAKASSNRSQKNRSGAKPTVSIARLSRHHASAADAESPSTERGTAPSCLTENVSSHNAKLTTKRPERRWTTVTRSSLKSVS